MHFRIVKKKKKSKKILDFYFSNKHYLLCKDMLKSHILSGVICRLKYVSENILGKKWATQNFDSYSTMDLLREIWIQ